MALARRPAVPLRVPAPGGGLGPLLGADGRGAAADPGARGDRDPEVLQRAGVVHARQPVPARRGARSWRGYFVGAGFNSVGIASAGGAGRALAEWIVAGEPQDDLVGVDVRRFAPFHGDNRVAAVPGGGGARACTTPCRGPTASSSRRDRNGPRRCTTGSRRPGALFGARMGWERPNVFGRRRAWSYSWGKPSWLPWSAAEQRATRDRRRGLRPDVVLASTSSPARTRSPACSGSARPTSTCRSAAASTRRSSTRAGTYEADLTVTRTGDGLVPARLELGDHGPRPGLAGRATAYPRRDVTEEHAVLGVMGPRSRDAARRRCRPDDWSEDGFPFATSREIDRGRAWRCGRPG